jgi:enamine deaminase RidA (YjgF/YER057c/UK114 family)
MEKDVTMILRREFTGRFNRVVEAGGFIFLSGVVARDTGGDVKVQTLDVLHQIDGLLAGAQASKHDIVSANIWLSDIGMIGQMNDAWDMWLDKDHAPVRATVESRLARDDLLVEIQVQAFRRSPADA